MANLPLDFDRLGARIDNATLLNAAGVKLMFSTHDSVLESHGAYLVRQIAGNAVAYGLPHEAALAAITRIPAEAFGLEDQFGSLAPGKKADLVIWSGDPLELLSNAEIVIVGGQVMSMTTRATRLRDRYRDLDPDLPHVYRK